MSRHLSGSLSKSGPLDFGTKNNFPSFFVIEKGLVHIYKKAIYYFQFLIVSFPQKRNGIVFSSGVNYLHSGGNIQSE